jgi:hypothetical protein
MGKLRTWTYQFLSLCLAGPRFAWLQSHEWAWFGGLLLGGFTVGSMNEFGLAVTFFALSALSAIAQMWTWTEANVTKGSMFIVIRAVGILFILTVFMCLFGITNVYRNNRSWSQLPAAWNAMLIASTIRTEKLGWVPDPPGFPYPPPAEGVYVPYSPPVRLPIHPINYSKSPIAITSTNQVIFQLFFKKNVATPVKVFHVLGTVAVPTQATKADQIRKEDKIWNQFIAAFDGKKDKTANVITTMGDGLFSQKIESSVLTPEEKQRIVGRTDRLYFLYVVQDSQTRKHLIEFCGYFDPPNGVASCNAHTYPED